MTLFILSYLAGALTIVAPCILPVLPFVFARAGKPFLKNGLPMLAGMAASFAAVATLATLGGEWAAGANEAGRAIALVILAAMGLALLLPGLAERLARPLVALGARLGESAERDAAASGRSVVPSAILGVATGLLWAPCAGPVLGLVLTTAALQGASAHTSLLLLAYAAGAATSLGFALWAGSRVFAAMKRAIGLGEVFRRGLGVAVLAAVTVVALGLDTSLVARIAPAGSNAIEQALVDRFGAPAALRVRVPVQGVQAPSLQAVAVPAPLVLPVEGRLPDLSGATTWLNSKPLSAESLRGKVVLVDFWTFGCVNCQHALPYVRDWANKYRDQGLVVVAVHSPEFAFERRVDSVKKAAADLRLDFPIAIDNDFAIWKSFSNQYWPAHYFVDAEGRIRFHHFGEGEYEKSEQVIRQLLDDAKAAKTPGATGKIAMFDGARP